MVVLDGLIALYLLAHGIIAILCDCQSSSRMSHPRCTHGTRRRPSVPCSSGWSKRLDFLVGTNPLWFKATIAGEVLLQVPLCFVLSYGWFKARQWVRTPGLMYSVHVLTTMVPIMTELCVDARPTSRASSSTASGCSSQR